MHQEVRFKSRVKYLDSILNGEVGGEVGGEVVYLNNMHYQQLLAKLGRIPDQGYQQDESLTTRGTLSLSLCIRGCAYL